MKKRIYSIFLALLMVVEILSGAVLPINYMAVSAAENDSFSGSQRLSGTISRILSKEELAYGGVNVVPYGLSLNKEFMSAYVYNSNELNLNGSFIKAGNSNNNSSGKTLPRGRIEGKKSGWWHASYKWTPTQEQIDTINGGGTLCFETSVIPDKHSHWNWRSWTYDDEWSTAGFRLSLSDENGNNTWTWGENDYGYKPNGENILSDLSAEKNDGQPQTTKKWWGSLPFDEDRSLFFNAYQLWDRNCGSAAVSGTVFYIEAGDIPEVLGVSSNAASYQPFAANAEYTVTVYFSRDIRFADNKAHDNIKLYLDAEYLAKSVENTSFKIEADFVAMDRDSMTFSFKMDDIIKEHFGNFIDKHFRIVGVSDDQPYFEKETELLVYDSKGNPLNKVSLTSQTILSDLYGSGMYSFDGRTFRNPLEFDGVSPSLTKVEMIGSGITVNASEPDSWESNSGSRSDIFAGSDGDSYGFILYFNEKIKVANSGQARAILSVTDEYGKPVQLKIQKVNDTSIEFESFTVEEGMLSPGERIYIESFENLYVTDFSGNGLSRELTGDYILPAQQIFLDVDAPYIDSDEELRPDSEAGRFSYSVCFADVEEADDYSGIAGKNSSFRLEVDGGGEYAYQWYIDNKQNISASANWKAGVTGSDNLIEDITDNRDYWIHFDLDQNIDYNYSVKNDGVYFNGTLVVNAITDWAGNTGADAQYDLELQVDKNGPESLAPAQSSATPDYENNSVIFRNSVSAADNFALSALYYQWEIAVGDGDFEPVGDEFTEIVVADGTLMRSASKEVGEYVYEYEGTNEETKYGRVRLKTYSKDVVGYVSTIEVSEAVYFDFRKAVNQSYVETNDAAHAVTLPRVHMSAPAAVGETENKSVSLLIIPDINSMVNGEYTEFWVWIPWHEYPENPLGSYIYAYENDTMGYVGGLYYHVTGSIDLDKAESDFGSGEDDGRYKLNRKLDDDASAEEIEALKAAQKEFYDYLTKYYGKMELYTVATSSLDIANNLPSINFIEEDSVINNYTVYIMNGTEYSLTDVVIRNEKGQTDSQVPVGAAKLDYVTGESRPARTNLDNVSVTIRLENITDEDALGGVIYGLDYIDFEKSTIKLYDTSGRQTNLEDLYYWYGDDELKTWKLVKSADGVNTIVFDKNLCQENGWYTLAISVYNTDGDVVIEKIIGHFFIDNTTLDMTVDSYYKSFYNPNDSYGYDSVEWELEDIEQAYVNGEEIRIGLAPIPEGWVYDNVWTSGHEIQFSVYGRPGSPNDDGAESDDLARAKVYNQTFNARAGLDRDEGVWRVIENDNTDEIFTYTPYLADPEDCDDPYGGASEYLLPFVDGANLIVYEVIASNGIPTTKTLVIYAEADPVEWEFSYEVEYQEGTENALSVTVWPSAPDGSAFDLDFGENRKEYVQGTTAFREYENRSKNNFVESYTYTGSLVDQSYILFDENGNVSIKTLTVYGKYGEILEMDNDPPYYTDFNARTEMVNGNLYAYDCDRYTNGDTFHANFYTYDIKNWIDIQDIYLTFDAEYSSILTGVGTRDEEGRLTMQIPIALDENGEPLLDENGNYAVWESTDPQYNGIYRTQVIQYGSAPEDEFIYGGYVEVGIWLTWKYDESLVNTQRTLWTSSADSFGNKQDIDGIGAEMHSFYPPVHASDGYVLGSGALAKRENREMDITQTVILPNQLNEDGTVGIYSSVPLTSISGYGVGEVTEISFFGDIYTGSDWASEGRHYYYTAPMIYKDGTYEFTVTDVFGEEYVIPVEVTAYGEPAVEVEFSTTAPTNQSITVTAAAINPNDTIVSIEASDGTVGTVDGEDPTHASITVTDNCTVTVVTELDYELNVRVTNIDKVLEPASVVYYDQNYRLLDTEIGASEVIALLTCKETIIATNGDERYVFKAGARAGDTYTFEYRDLAGNTGSITAVLGCDLELFEEEITEADTEAPDLTTSLYTYASGSYTLIERLRNPVTEPDDTESPVTAGLNSEENSGFKMLKARLTLNVSEDSAYKVLAVPGGSSAPTDYDSAVQGCDVDGIAMSVGNDTVIFEITKNTIFDIYVIDKNGNTTALTDIKITKINTTAPILNVRYEFDTDDEGIAVIKAIFELAEEDRFEKITALTPGVEEIQTEFGTGYYYVFTGNGTFTFEYMDSVGNRGAVTAMVSALDTSAAVVHSVSWYGTVDENGRSNVTPERSVPVNKDVTAQLSISKPVRMAELYRYNPEMQGGFGDILDENDPVKLSFTSNTISVVYTDAVDDEIIVRYYTSENGVSGSRRLPAVDCIDKTAPTAVIQETVTADDKQTVTFFINTSEETVFTLGKDMEFKKDHLYTTASDTPVTLYFTDKAGNRGSIRIDEFGGLDRTKLAAVYSLSADGSNATDDPLSDLTLFAGGTFYVKVNKNAEAVIGGNSYTVTANSWKQMALPNTTGIHILKLTDSNTGKIVYETVSALPKDNVAPVVSLDTDTVFVYVSDSVAEMMQAIGEGVTVSDDVTADPTFTVKGYPASPSEGGLYSLIYTAVDEAGNKTTAERTLYILEETDMMILFNGEVGLPYGKVYVERGKVKIESRNLADDQPVVIKFRKGIFTTGQMKYYAETVENMTFETTETGNYTVYVRTQDRNEFVTYLYVEE